MPFMEATLAPLKCRFFNTGPFSIYRGGLEYCNRSLKSKSPHFTSSKQDMSLSWLATLDVFGFVGALGVFIQ
jgi:hypothetical protein